MPTRRSSGMEVYTKLSPNCTKPRGSVIKRLTPHCVAGNLSIERTLNLPRMVIPQSPGLSVTYAIGTDGRIGLGVEEFNRPWTSSSSYNDNRAITFEIANNGGDPDWRMSDKAINSWLDLSENICRFYGYKKVNYKTKPSEITGKDAVEAWIKTWEKADEMIITLHRWFAAKSCPGPYFIRQLPWLVKELNNRLSGGTKHIFYGEGVVPPPPPFTPYVIKINAYALNIRKGPGTNYPIVQTLRNDPYHYTIIEESTGQGAKLWGKLKSGIGWIALDYTIKV